MQRIKTLGTLFVLVLAAILLALPASASNAPSSLRAWPLDTAGRDQPRLVPSAETIPYAWHTFYGPAGTGGAYGTSVAVDSHSDIYIAGISGASFDGPSGQAPRHAFAGSYNLLVLKLDRTGAYQWHTFFAGINDVSYPQIGVASDSGPTIVATADTTWNGPNGEAPLNPSGTAGDLAILKLDANGDYRWHTFLGGAPVTTGMGGDYSTGIAVDRSNDVFVTGRSERGWTGPNSEAALNAFSGYITDSYILKVSAAGVYRWHTFYRGANHEGSAGIGLDADGNVYMAGVASAFLGPNGEQPLHSHSYWLSDVAVLTLTSAGAYRWHTFYGGNQNDVATGIAIDGGGNVIVIGYSLDGWLGPDGASPLRPYGTVGSITSFVLKLSAAGAYRWHTFYWLANSVLVRVIADAGGDIYVMGDAWCPDLLKYDAGGTYKVSTILDMCPGSFARMASDSRGGFYVAGGRGSTVLGPGGQAPLHAYTGTGNYHVLLIRRGTARTFLPLLTR